MKTLISLDELWLFLISGWAVLLALFAVEIGVAVYLRVATRADRRRQQAEAARR